MDYGVPSTAGDYPLDFVVAIINFLMFSIRGYKREVAGRQFLSLRAVWSPDDGAVAACSVDDCV